MTLEPGLDRHEWTTEFAQIEEGMHDDPFGALPALTELVERMLLQRGYELVPERDDGGIVHEFLDAKAIAAEGEQAAPGDVALALEKLVAIYQFRGRRAARSLTKSVTSFPVMGGGQSPLRKCDAVSTPVRTGQAASFSPPRGL
jgi:hypothetical protein